MGVRISTAGRRLACGVAAAAIALVAAEAAADILTCVGPAGEVLYSNRDCPPGYELRAAEAAQDGPSFPGPTPPAAPAEQPPPPQEPPPAGSAREAVDEQCFVGSFRTDEAPGSIDVYFTNAGPRACRRVKFYCLWGLGAGADFYQQSDTGTYEGRIEAGATLLIGELRPSGPAAGDVSWSWCAIR